MTFAFAQWPCPESASSLLDINHIPCRTNYAATFISPRIGALPGKGKPWRNDSDGRHTPVTLDPASGCPARARGCPGAPPPSRSTGRCRDSRSACRGPRAWGVEQRSRAKGTATAGWNYAQVSTAHGPPGPPESAQRDGRSGVEPSTRTHWARPAHTPEYNQALDGRAPRGPPGRIETRKRHRWFDGPIDRRA